MHSKSGKPQEVGALTDQFKATTLVKADRLINCILVDQRRVILIMTENTILLDDNFTQIQSLNKKAIHKDIR